MGRPRVALITGSAGLVGRHFARELTHRGWDVHGWDIANGLDCRYLFGNDTAVYDMVVHAAASAPHRAAIDGEPSHFAVNIGLDADMFDWAARTRQKRIVYLSSSAAYPIRLQSGEWVRAYGQRPLAEHLINVTQWGKTGDWSPDAVYGWTKLTGEMLAASARQLGVPVTVLRPFSGYSEDQTELFPFRALVERARRREDPFTIWGDGNQVRDWVHMTDVVAGALAVAESGTTDPVNLCTGTGTSMRELAQMACAAAGYAPRFQYLTDKPAGVLCRIGDPARLHQYYKPQIDLAEGVHRAMEA